MGVDIDHGHVKGSHQVAATTTATIKATPGRVWGVQVSFPDDTLSIELKDGGASGTLMWKQPLIISAAGDGIVDINLHGLYFATDIYMAKSANVVASFQYT